MDLGGLVLLLLATPFLAAIGITTLAAFAFMIALGLLTEMSFKRLFIVSFFMGLAAPILLAGAVFASFEDGTFERDLRDGIEQFVDLPQDNGREFGGALGRLQEIGREAQRGDITEEQAEDRIRELFVGPRDENGDESSAETPQIPQEIRIGENVQISIDGGELSEDGDEVRITID